MSKHNADNEIDRGGREKDYRVFCIDIERRLLGSWSGLRSFR
jgi:hypothetical protein